MKLTTRSRFDSLVRLSIVVWGVSLMAPFVHAVPPILGGGEAEKKPVTLTPRHLRIGLVLYAQLHHWRRL
jgi:hypothetical protein